MLAEVFCLWGLFIYLLIYLFPLLNTSMYWYVYFGKERGKGIFPNEKSVHTESSKVAYIQVFFLK